MTARPISDPPARVRQRARADGSWRIWWEPEAGIRGLGFTPVELDPKRLTWSTRRAERLNADVDRARKAEARQARGGRTVSALVAEYTRSPAWARLRPDTQRDYRGGLRIIEDKWGGDRVELFTPAIGYEWSETLTRDRGAWQAAALMRKFSLLMSYGVRRGWIKANPFLRLGVATPRPRDRVVDWAELDALTAAAARLDLDGIRLALLIGFYTGQRQADVIGARAGMIGPDNVWRFERSKARDGSPQRAGVVALHPDILPDLRARMAAAPADAPLVAQPDGAAYSPDLFRKHWARVRAEATRRAPSVADIQFRDLRRSWAWWAREGGADARDRADGMGNQSDKDARLGQTYNPPTAAGARRAVLAIRRPAASDDDAAAGGAPRKR